MAIFNINDDDYLDCVKKHDLTEALFGYSHLYLLIIPSNDSFKPLQPLISHQLHLLPFPPRYIPYEGGKKIKYLLMVGLMACAYRTDFKFWQLTTRFIDGPNGNPFLDEKWLWEGVIKLLKSEKDYEKEFCMKKRKKKK
ncbi:hypothetical protein C2G38_2180352 [Gigaspora rosea]|uniref:Uncharacterized protein n=1 Tax=Gigaspora rosea TaxID=44941 RepID=A0A397VFC3_9GLOM|nr:hypothetical protein C2G38_2180352 [Gigaspora rosea]